MRHLSDFRRLWLGTAVSQVGSAIGLIALPIVAVQIVHASTLKVSLLALAGAVTTTVAAFPLGAWVEFRLKRPVMIASDIVRTAAQGSVPLAALLGHVTYLQLVVVAIINAAGAISFSASSQAHLVGLVGRDELVSANARLQATNWIGLTTGPLVGGLLVAAVGAPTTLWVDAASFIVSAIAVISIRSAEAHPTTKESQRRWSIALLGLRAVARDRILSRILLNWMIFAGCIGMIFPLETVFMLRTIHLSTLQYGLVYGISSAGGLIGSLLTPWVVRTLGYTKTLWLGSAARGLLLFAFAAAPNGLPGFVVCAASMTAILLVSSAVNSAMASYRQLRTPDHLLARVGALWSASTSLAQPVLILTGGFVGELVSTRAAIILGGALITAALVLLPRHLEQSPTVSLGAVAELSTR